MIADRAKQLERTSRQDSSGLNPAELLAMTENDDWTVRMHVCRMLPRVEWSPADYPEVVRFAFEQAKESNKFVQAWALDALAHLAVTDPSIRPAVRALLKCAMLAAPPAVRIRAREGLKLLPEISEL